VSRLSFRQIAVIVGCALVGWALCFATIGIGMATTSLPTALIIHAVAAPLFFFGLSWLYFSRFGYTTPLFTAAAFLVVVMFMDFFFVALVILRSFVMFTSFLGTWLPFMLIFASTLVTGLLVHSRRAPRARGAYKL